MLAKLVILYSDGFGPVNELVLTCLGIEPIGTSVMTRLVCTWIIRMYGMSPPLLDLDHYNTVEELQQLGMDRLKTALLAIQCKCGGSLEERAQRLFSLKGLERKDYPTKVRGRNFVV